MLDDIRISTQIPEHANNWGVTVAGATLITSEVAAAYMLYNYGTFLCSDMYNKYNMYNALSASDLKKALDAWNAEYNPISNYDKTEKDINIDSYGDTTDTRTTGDGNGGKNTVQQLAAAGTKSESYTTTYDNEQPRLETRDTNEGGTVTTDDLQVNNEKTHTNTSVTYDGSTYTGHEIHIHENNTAGNIGVTTSQQMIMSETDMRLNPLIKQYLDKFIYTYAIYIGGAWR